MSGDILFPEILAVTLFHGFPPSWVMGLVIYAYPLAWASALIISYRPIFGSKPEIF